MEKIETNYKNLNHWAEWLVEISKTYKAHAGKSTFVDDVLATGCAKHLKQLSRMLYKMAREIQEQAAKGE